MAEKLSYKLDVFEGPLDLLLHLISKNKLNIIEIRLSQLLDQYMEKITQMQEEQMEVSSEFLEMAAKLVYLKTASLLPNDEEAEKIEKELTGQLLEYQECKRIAAVLAQQVSFDRFSRAPQEFEVDQTYTGTHELKELYDAFFAAAGRGARKMPPPAESFSAIVAHPIVSVETGVFHVLRLLRRGSRNINHMFESEANRSKRVATFLAILELIRAGRICLDKDGMMGLQEGKRKDGDQRITSGN